MYIITHQLSHIPVDEHADPIWRSDLQWWNIWQIILSMGEKYTLFVKCSTNGWEVFSLRADIHVDVRSDWI